MNDYKVYKKTTTKKVISHSIQRSIMTEILSQTTEPCTHLLPRTLLQGHPLTSETLIFRKDRVLQTPRLLIRPLAISQKIRTKTKM